MNRGAAMMDDQQDQPAQVAELPFLFGSGHGETTPFATVQQLIDTEAHEYEFNITPGGFLRGVLIQVTNDSSGDIGTANLAPDAPYAVISSLTLEDISGEGVLKPMSCFAHAMKQKWFSPWDGDPAKRADFSASINPAFTLRAMNEVRDTLAVLPNTDARAQYRIKLTIAPLAALVDTPANVTTPPTVTIKIAPLKWYQPDAVDLLGTLINPEPDGVSASRFFQHQLYNEFSAADNTPRLELVGQEIRALGFIIRDSTGARIDLTDTGAGSIIFTMDDRTFWKRLASQWVEEMNSFYDKLADGTWTRETGVYIIPKFRKPGDLVGEFWLQTIEQNDLRLEIQGGDLGNNTPGSIEVLYDNLAVEAGNVLPPELEGI